MNINWETIVDGFRGFEKLALEFVEENEPQNGCSLEIIFFKNRYLLYTLVEYMKFTFPFLYTRILTPH